MLDLSLLNDHSRHFATLLFRRWPEWIHHARFDPYEEFEPEALLVEVPRPADGSGHGLFITTSEWEIAVGYGDNFHTRFGAGDSDGGDFYAEALVFIADFVAEQVVVATARQRGDLLGVWPVDLRREDPRQLVQTEGMDLQVRSWLGTHDQDLSKGP